MTYFKNLSTEPPGETEGTHRRPRLNKTVTRLLAEIMPINFTPAPAFSEFLSLVPRNLTFIQQQIHFAFQVLKITIIWGKRNSDGQG